MKFILYFHFYLLSIGDSIQSYNIHTSIWMKNDSLSFYVHNVGYIKWAVEYKLRETIQEVRPNVYIVQAIYFVSYESVKAIVYIDSPEAEIKILTGNVPFLIQLKY